MYKLICILSAVYVGVPLFIESPVAGLCNPSAAAHASGLEGD